MTYCDCAEYKKRVLQKMNSRQKLKCSLKTDNKRLINIHMKIELDCSEVGDYRYYKNSNIQLEKGYKSLNFDNDDTTTITSNYDSFDNPRNVKDIRKKRFARCQKNSKNI